MKERNKLLVHKSVTDPTLQGILFASCIYRIAQAVKLKHLNPAVSKWLMNALHVYTTASSPVMQEVSTWQCMKGKERKGKELHLSV